jgi:hypothetical protein
MMFGLTLREIVHCRNIAPHAERAQPQNGCFANTNNGEQSIALM